MVSSAQARASFGDVLPRACRAFCHEGHVAEKVLVSDLVERGETGEEASGRGDGLLDTIGWYGHLASISTTLGRLTSVYICASSLDIVDPSLFPMSMQRLNTRAFRACNKNLNSNLQLQLQLQLRPFASFPKTHSPQPRPTNQLLGSKFRMVSLCFPCVASPPVRPALR